MKIKDRPEYQEQIKWLALAETLSKLPPCIVGMEACLSAHFVNRCLRQLGHEPRIIPAIYVKPFVKGQKNDYKTPRPSPRRRYDRTCGPCGRRPKINSIYRPVTVCDRGWSPAGRRRSTR